MRNEIDGYITLECVARQDVWLAIRVLDRRCVTGMTHVRGAQTSARGDRREISLECVTQRNEMDGYITL